MSVPQTPACFTRIKISFSVLISGFGTSLTSTKPTPFVVFTIAFIISMLLDPFTKIKYPLKNCSARCLQRAPCSAKEETDSASVSSFF